jgi:putative methionine-R-sulfoxide reductase with GAF domain
MCTHERAVCHVILCLWVGRVSSQTLVGVLDLDATNLNGFDADDQHGLEALAQCLVAACDWPPW